MRDKGSQPLRIVRQEDFCLGLVNGLSKAEAFVAAGYKGSIRSNPTNLANKPVVQERISFLRNRVAEKATNAAAVTRSEIVESVRRRREKADKGIPLMARDGTPTDVFKPDFAAGNKADEILARMHGFLLDVNVEENLDDVLDSMSPDDLKTFLRTMQDQVDPNMSKRFGVEAEVPAIEAEIVESSESDTETVFQ